MDHLTLSVVLVIRGTFSFKERDGHGMIQMKLINTTKYLCRVIFMEDHIPIRPDRDLLLGRQTSQWSSWDVVYHLYSISIGIGLIHYKSLQIIV